MVEAIEVGNQPAAASIAITVIGGYLGAGKTTLLNRLLREPRGRRLGVIVNDFGSIGIDADVLAGARASGVVNLPNGCVCCTLGGDLFETLATLRDSDTPPDHIVIEVSGVADPAAAAAWGTSAGFELGGVIVLAAADQIRRQVRDEYVGSEVRRQLGGADVIVMTRTDLCDSVTVDAATATVTDFAPDVPIVPGADGVDVDVVLGLRAELHPPSAVRAHEDIYVRWSTLGGTVRRSSFEAFLTDLPPGLLRMKGIVSFDDGTAVSLQIVGAAEPIVTASPAVETQLEAIGISGVLDTARLVDVFAKR